MSARTSRIDVVASGFGAWLAAAAPMRMEAVAASVIVYRSEREICGIAAAQPLQGDLVNTARGRMAAATPVVHPVDQAQASEPNEDVRVSWCC